MVSMYERLFERIHSIPVFCLPAYIYRLFEGIPRDYSKQWRYDLRRIRNRNKGTEDTHTNTVQFFLSYVLDEKSYPSRRTEDKTRNRIVNHFRRHNSHILMCLAMPHSRIVASSDRHTPHIAIVDSIGIKKHTA